MTICSWICFVFFVLGPLPCLLSLYTDSVTPPLLITTIGVGVFFNKKLHWIHACMHFMTKSQAHGGG